MIRQLNFFASYFIHAYEVALKVYAVIAVVLIHPKGVLVPKLPFFSKKIRFIKRRVREGESHDLLLRGILMAAFVIEIYGQYSIQINIMGRYYLPVDL